MICINLADSIKVGLGIGNGALRIYCLMITQAYHCLVLYTQITKATFIVLGISVSLLVDKANKVSQQNILNRLES